MLTLDQRFFSCACTCVDAFTQKAEMVKCKQHPGQKQLHLHLSFQGHRIFYFKYVPLAPVVGCPLSESLLHLFFRVKEEQHA